MRVKYKIYRYITIVIVLALASSCVIDSGYYYAQKNRATVVCERTLGVIKDYMIFTDMALMFNEYLKTDNEYKLLVLSSHMKGWSVAPVDSHWSVTLQGRQYMIYPDDKPVNEVGSEWRVDRLLDHVAGNVYEHCYIRCVGENEYRVESDNIITRGYSDEIYSGPVNMVVKREIGEDRYVLAYSLEASGEYVVDRFYRNSEEERVVVKYIFDGKCAKYDSYSELSFTSGKADIKAGKVGTAESTFDDIKFIYSGGYGGYYNMTITLNGKRVESR